MKTLKFAPLLALVLSSGMAQGGSWRLLSSWDSTATPTQEIAGHFVKGVEDASGGKDQIAVFGPETVAPFEQLEPTGSGVFQFLVTVGAYHSGDTVIGTTMDAMTGTPQDMRDAGIWDWYDQYYQKNFNLKLIALTFGEGAYRLILRDPLSEAGDLQGRKMRGTQVYQGVYDLLGAVTVSMAAGEVYSSLEKGIIDGAGWGSYSMAPNRWEEVAPYALRPYFGNSALPIFMNLDAFNAADAETQQMLLDQGKAVEEYWAGRFEELKVADEGALIAGGAKLEDLPAETAGKLDAAFMKGIWLNAEAQLPGPVKEIHDLGIKAGLTE